MNTETYFGDNFAKPFITDKEETADVSPSKSKKMGHAEVASFSQLDLEDEAPITTEESLEAAAWADKIPPLDELFSGRKKSKDEGLSEAIHLISRALGEPFMAMQVQLETMQRCIDHVLKILTTPKKRGRPVGTTGIKKRASTKATKAASRAKLKNKKPRKR